MSAKREYASTSSVAIIGLITFVGDSARGLIFPALWPLCESFGGTKVDLGWLIATFSIGRLLTSVNLGKFADIYRHKLALVLSNLVMILGALLWACSPKLGGLGSLYAGQFLMGVGTGSLGVTRSYIVEQTDPVNRTYILARLSSLQYAGFSVTPIFGAILVVAGSHMSIFWKYAFPAFLIVALGVLCVTLLISVFQDIKEEQFASIKLKNLSNKNVIDDSAANTVEMSHKMEVSLDHTSFNPILFSNINVENKSKDIENDDSLSSSTNSSITSTDSNHDKANRNVLPLLNNVERGANSTSSNLINAHQQQPPVNSNMFQICFSKVWLYFSNCCRPSPVEGYDAAAMKDLGIVYMLMMTLNFTTRGAIAVYETQCSQLILGYFKLNELSLGAIVSTAGIIGTFQLLFFKQIWVSHFTDMQLMLGGFAVMGIPQFLIMQFGVKDTVRLWRFLLPLYLMYSVGYPVGNSGVLGAFSMLQKSGRQGSAQGQFALMGSLARVMLPILSGYFEVYIEESASFSIVLVLMAASSIAVLWHYDKIIYFTKTVNPTSSKGTNISVSSTAVTTRTPPFQTSHFLLILFWLGISCVAISTIFDIGKL